MGAYHAIRWRDPLKNTESAVGSKMAIEEGTVPLAELRGKGGNKNMRNREEEKKKERKKEDY
jgi:hypothetical protein